MNNQKQDALVQLGGTNGVSRRQAMQWVMAAMAASAVPARGLGDVVAPSQVPRNKPGLQPAPGAKGYGVDANLVAVHHPGDLWPLTFTPAQRKTAAALADVILPADQYGPAASEVGVVAMMDEWVSAPYPQQQGDRPVILDGLAWLDDESNRRFKMGFADIAADQKHAVCDDICFPGSAKKEFAAAARFFERFRSLCAGAYYATPAGFKAIGYVGNTPLASFDGPPPEVLVKLGVTQTVK